MSDAPLIPKPDLVVSIVSHGHGPQVLALLKSVARLNRVVSRVVLTLNVPEPELRAAVGNLPFTLEVLCNEAPLGFGANHNKALAGATETHVCILNPDVVLDADPFESLMGAVAGKKSTCAYPVQVDGGGRIQDSEREIPSLWTLFRRRLMGRSEVRVDWVNAACLLMPTALWRELKGFDERYFMYCEDVDFCLRLKLNGGHLVKVPVKIIHAGQRASQRRLNHLAWHVRSLLRLWASPVYWRAQQLLTRAPSSKGTIGTR
ncbi:glycosyltransferase [Acidovorax sp. LjRoot129]|uniref:glycosyltransferase family 2 protein n=1 Tax=Acidovorax sp. LjRoot129 TaxID=3342260 RepID=UPI003ED14EA6